MANYNLITTLVMNAAGYDKGINQAKQKTSDLVKTTESAGKFITKALSFAGIALSFQTVVNTLKTGLESTGEGADFLAKKTMQVKSAVDALGRSILEGDLENLGRNIKAALQAASDYADAIDLNDTRTKDLSLKKSYLDAKVKELQALQQEGKLNKQQAEDLKKYNEDVFNTEKSILQSRIDYYIQYSAKMKSIEEDAFSRESMLKGVLERADMNEQEIKDLSKYVDDYNKELQRLDKIAKEANTKIIYATPSGDSPPVPIEQFNRPGYEAQLKKSISDYIRSIESEAGKAQIFEDIFGDEQGWSDMIGYFEQLNMSMGEFNRNQKKIQTTAKEGSVPQAAAATAIVRSPGVSPIPTGNIAIPSVAQALNPTLAASPKQILQTEDWVKNAEIIGESVMSLAGAFDTLGNAIEQASSDGEISFSDAMNVISQAALSAIPIITALAAAQMISSQASKGLIGIVTAIAGVTLLLGLFAKYASPKKMAAGGLVYSASNVMVGEYANARNNPEVIAPLDKLKGMLGGSEKAELTTRVSGGDLVFVLNNYNRKINSFA